MTSNVSIPSAATMTGGSDGLVPNLPPSEPPFLLFEESDNKYWGVADRDVPILIGAAAGLSFDTNYFFISNYIFSYQIIFFYIKLYFFISNYLLFPSHDN